MLASSIDFEVEFKLVAFIQFTHARAFDRTDVNERIRLPVFARDKAKALHRVEELDRAHGLFAGQLPLRRGRFGCNRDHVADNLQIGRRNLSAAIDQVELQLLTFGQTFKASAFDCADVHEHIFAAVFTLNEAKAFLGVEEFYNTLAGADDLGRHTAAAACATTTAAWAAEAATATARAAKAAACTITAAKAAATAACTIATAKAAAITTAAAATEAATTTAATAAEAATIIASAAATAAAETTVGVEIAVFAETVALVASATPPSVKTHKNQ